LRLGTYDGGARKGVAGGERWAYETWMRVRRGCNKVGKMQKARGSMIGKQAVNV
jgi:hypothetical protein